MKSIFKSRTFWMNTLMAVGAITGTLPTGTATILAGAAINVALRKISKGTVYVIPPKETDE